MSALHHKQEYPPLLPQGFHPLDIAELRALCVESFPGSTCRDEIMAGLEIIHDGLVALNLTGEVWIDGSFLTRKTNPQDVDLVVMLPARFYDAGTPEPQEFIDWLINNEDDPKKSFHCHTDVGLVYDEKSALHYLTTDTLQHWEGVFGFSVADKTPKGIAVIRLLVIPEEPVAEEEKGVDAL